ncbi:MAG: alginate lyase family protein, partial [Pseudomonadales bacterium]|nr:alginate lyase family protein [Pseudomonadales bacterium]
MIGRYIFIFALSLAYISTSSADIRTLVPPQGYYTAIDSGKRYDDTCNPLPLPHTGNLNFRSKYEGSQTARDQLNKAAYKDYKTKTQDINQFEKRTNKLIDQFMNSGQTKLLHCAVSGLRQWATAGALLSKDSNHTGRAIRKWVLGSVSGAYLRLKFSKSNPLAGLNNDTDVIESWFTALAEQVIDDWDSPPLEKMNNHEYWAAWAVMSTSISLNRHDMFLWAIQQYLIAMGQITEEGYLPNELKRETRGLAYHNYSLNPLTMIAAFSE